ncbi:MAG TPA: hypothetical protein VMP86_05830 [Candidatus Binatia bacterium]|nr:hypothetical protein [Candidatus Binatia bacterium]
MAQVHRLSLLVLVVGTIVASLLVGDGARVSLAVFGAQEETSATTSTAACFVDDPAAPTVTASVIAKTTPYLGGAIREGGAYYVYANVSPGALPVAAVTADVRPLTSGEFLVPMTAGAYSVEGTSYGYRSGALAAESPLAEGSTSYSVSASDTASECRTVASTVAVDNTPPVGTDVQPTNGGGPPGRIQAGDSITYSFSEVIDPESVLAGWAGAPQNVVVQVTNNGNNDLLTIWDTANATQLALGSTDVGGNFVTTDVTLGATGTPSTMVQSGTTITVTFGTPTGTTQMVTQDATAIWTPSAAATDAAGNPGSTTSVTESGPADRNF